MSRLDRLIRGITTAVLHDYVRIAIKKYSKTHILAHVFESERRNCFTVKEEIIECLDSHLSHMARLQSTSIGMNSLGIF